MPQKLPKRENAMITFMKKRNKIALTRDIDRIYVVMVGRPQSALGWRIGSSFYISRQLIDDSHVHLFK